MKAVKIIAYTLTIIGALNWGLVGLFRFDLVQAIFRGATSYDPGTVTRIVYVIIALAALYLLTLYDKITRED